MLPALLAGGMTLRPALASQRPVVVELFTSQGCNSCPPADAYLGELTRRADVLPLAYHVDYWDYIGWKDPFAQRAWTDRQRGYSAGLGLRSIYTPQMVIDGRIDAVGSRRDQVERAIRTARDTVASVQLDLARKADGAIAVTLSGPEKSAVEADLIFVTYDRRHETKVLRGENAGKTLVEYNIVRGAKRIDTWRGGRLERILSATDLPSQGEQGVAIVQTRGQGPILAAASIALR
jgi:hypothetical protein